MTCQETKKNLSDYLDGRLAPEATEEVSAHLARCTACRAELADLRRIDAVLGALDDPPVDESRLMSLWSRVEMQLDATPATAAPQEAAPYLTDAPALVTPGPAAQPRWLMPTLVVGGVVTLAVAVLTVALVIQEGSRGAPKDSAGNVARGAGTNTRVGHPMSTGSGTASSSSGAMAPVDAGAMTPETMTMRVVVAVAPMDTGMTPEAMSSGSASASSSSSSSSAGASKRRRRRGSSASMHATSHSTAMRVTSSSSSSSSSMGSSSLQDLLRRAGSSMSDSSSMSAADANLPQRLSPGAIRQGVARVVGSARACYKRYGVAGTVRVRVVIKGSTGRVVSAHVLGSFSGTPTGRCVVRAFRRARFKRFKAQSQSFVFPMIFK